MHDEELDRSKREAVTSNSSAPVSTAGRTSGAAQAVTESIHPASVTSRSNAPGSIAKARDGKPDDLKLIWGVGPKLEILLNAAGFFHFDQIAKWGAADIERVASQLGEFGGRAVRDKWVEQCKKLATGWRPASDVGEKPE